MAVRRVRGIVLGSVMAMLAVSCGGAQSGAEPPPTAGASPAVESDPVVGTGNADEDDLPSADGEADGEAEPDVVALQPEIWIEAGLGSVSRGSASSGLTVVNDTIWAHAGAWDGALTARSTDRGATFEVIDVLPADNGGFQRSTIEGFVGSGDRVVAWGQASTGCVVTDVGDGRQVAERCRNRRAMIHLSTDGGTSWRQIASPSMAPAGDQNTVVRRVVVHDGGFVAVGAVQGQDWFGRVWESADGENWDVARDVRAPRGASEVVDVVSNGSELLLHWYQATCVFGPSSASATSAPTWSLGAVWPTDVNLLMGSDVASLIPVDPSESPLLPEPRVVDCDTADTFALSVEPYPSVEIAVLDGDLVFFERSEAVYEEVVADAEGDRFGPLRFSRLVGGAWTTTEFLDVPTAGDGFASDRFSAASNNGAFEFVDEISHHGDSGTRAISFVAVQTDGSADWAELPPVRGDGLAGVARIGDRTIALIETVPQGLESDDFTSSTLSLGVAVHEPGARRATCDLVPGGSCRYARLELVDGFPSFAGADLSGVDLSHADLADADFSGATLDDATMLGVNSRQAVFDRASLRGVDGRHGDFDDATGADFTGADLFQANVVIRAATDFENARLAETSIRAPFGGEPDAPAVELSLAGLDLRGTVIRGAFDGPLMIITDLSGAVLDERTRFSDVDLSTTVLTGVDITIVAIDDDSLCPAGLQPSGGSRGNCRPPE